MDCEALGDEVFRAHTSSPWAAAPEQAQAASTNSCQSLTEIYRQLLLSVITELWVDYGQMEALRVSIGLEAYASAIAGAV
jgi:preprotein translocase subunit SecA